MAQDAMTDVVRQAERWARAHESGVGEAALFQLQRLHGVASKRGAFRSFQSETGRTPNEPARNWLAFAPLWSTAGRETAVLDKVQQVQARCVDEDQWEPALRLWCEAGRIRLRRGDFEAISRERDSVERWLSRVDGARPYVKAHVILGHAAAWMGALDAASAHLLEAEAVADQEGLSFERSLVRAQWAHLHTHAGRMNDAFGQAEKAIVLARQAPGRRAFALAHWARGWAMARFARYDEASFSLQMAARTQQSLGEWAPAASSWARTIEVQMWRRDPAGLRRALRSGRAAARRAAGSSAEVEVHRVSALGWELLRDRSADFHLTRLAELAAQERDGRADRSLRALHHGQAGFFSEELRADQNSPGRPVVVGLDGSYFIRPDGRRVDLSRRRAVRALMARLARARDEWPGGAVETRELVRGVWSAGKDSDLHTAVWTLRKLGLEGALVRTESGYRLDPGRTRIRVD